MNSQTQPGIQCLRRTNKRACLNVCHEKRISKKKCGRNKKKAQDPEENYKEAWYRRQADAATTSQPQKTPTEATRKTTKNRQATLANALGNSISINKVDQIKISIESPGKHVEKEKLKEKQPSSLSSLTHEKGFKENSPEFNASIRFLNSVKTQSVGSNQLKKIPFN